MVVDLNKKSPSVAGRISLWLVPLEIGFFIIAYYLQLEMITPIMVTLLSAILGILLGIIGLMVSIRRRITKRGPIWGILLHILFIAALAIFFIMVMGGP